MRNVASCWIYIGILLGAHPILHISTISVNSWTKCLSFFGVDVEKRKRGFFYYMAECEETTTYMKGIQAL
jgi:hypothetical protein